MIRGIQIAARDSPGKGLIKWYVNIILQVRKRDKYKRWHGESTKTLIVSERGSVKKRTKIVLEIERTMVFKGSKDFQSLWCDGCGKEVRMITAELAAILVGTTSSTIQHRIEAGSIHNRQAPTGEALVCIESLQAH